jgi:hypothetical protein
MRIVLRISARTLFCKSPRESVIHKCYSIISLTFYFKDGKNKQKSKGIGQHFG